MLWTTRGKMCLRRGLARGLNGTCFTTLSNTNASTF